MGIEETIIMLAREEAYEKGFKLGFKQGLKLGAQTIARRMKQLGYPISMILKVTKLSLKEVTAL
jgi:predicted transposase YdaD